MVPSWPLTSLPTDYWTRPVHFENRAWWPILGAYPPYGVVGGGSTWPADTNTYMSNYNFVPYVQAPNTAHIVFKQQVALAGMIGGTAGQYGQTASTSCAKRNLCRKSISNNDRASQWCTNKLCSLLGYTNRSTILCDSNFCRRCNTTSSIIHSSRSRCS